VLGEGPWRRYFLVCANGIRPSWWDRILRRGFRHCYVLIWDGACWLYVDPTLYRLHVSILDYYQEENPLAWIDDRDVHVLEVAVEAEPKRMRAPWSVGPLTCVEGCKAALGVRSFWLWTPWRLYRYLEKRNVTGKQAEEVERGKGARRCASA
jgi:hypothetical protein